MSNLATVTLLLSLSVYVSARPYVLVKVDGNLETFTPSNSEEISEEPSEAKIFQELNINELYKLYQNDVANDHKSDGDQPISRSQRALGFFERAAIELSLSSEITVRQAIKCILEQQCNIPPPFGRMLRGK